MAEPSLPAPAPLPPSSGPRSSDRPPRDPRPPRPPHAPRSTALALVLLALVVRLAFALVFHLPQDLPAYKYEWDWGYEQVAVARSVARGDGYADPFLRDEARTPFAAERTGPTAWCGPVYPLVLAGMIRVTDGPNRATALALAALHALVSALTALGLLRLGEALGRPRLGLLSGLVWALLPSASYGALTIVWDSVLVGAGLVFTLLVHVRAVERARANPARARRALVPSGLALGALALLNPAVLAVSPAIALHVWVRLRAPLLGALARLGAVAAVAVPSFLVLLPWLVRNQVRLGVFAPKANLGVELMVGNDDQADGGFHPWVHPAYDPVEHARLRELGEGAYGAYAVGRFRAWASAHPGRFAELCVLRVRNFWLGLNPFEPVRLRSGAEHVRDWQGWMKWGLYFGLGVLALLGLVLHRDARGGRVLLGGAALLYPLAYYVTHVLERYRAPLEPLLVMLAVSAVLAGVRRLRGGHPDRAAPPVTS